MFSSRYSDEGNIRDRIDSLLDSSVDLDQIVILRSELFAKNPQIDRKYLELLEAISKYTRENARKVQEARELIIRVSRE